MTDLILPRRRFLQGITALVAAPAIVRAASLMPIKSELLVVVPAYDYGVYQPVYDVTQQRFVMKLVKGLVKSQQFPDVLMTVKERDAIVETRKWFEDDVKKQLSIIDKMAKRKNSILFSLRRLKTNGCSVERSQLYIR